MKKFLSFFAAMLVAVAANAAVINIDTSTANAIQGALNSAASGDEIVLAAGTYNESGNYLAFTGKNLIVRAAEGAEVIIKTVCPVRLKEGATAEFINVKFDCSTIGEYEQVIVAADDTDGKRVVLSGCEFYGWQKNKAMIQATSSRRLAQVMITDCYFHDCMKSVVFMENTNPSDLIIRNSTFANISTDASSFWAGVIDSRATSGIFVVDRCTFYNVLAMNTDYAAVGKVSNSTSTVTNSIFMLPASQDNVRAIRDVAEAVNCITYNYLKDSGKGIHSDVTKTNCIQLDPLFVNAAEGNFTLGEGSPALTLADGEPVGDPRWVPAEEPAAEPQVLYLKPGIWFNDVNNEKFAIYAFQDGKPEYWSDYMTLAEGETNIWTGTIPAGYTNLIFVRFGQNSTTPSWSDNMWNKTNDLTIQENADMYTISGWGDGEGAPCPGVWSKYVYEGPATFYITGNAALVGEAAWSEKAVKATEDSYVFEDLPAGYYQLKVLPTGSWDVNKGFDDLTTVAEGLSADNDRNICFTLDEAGDVTVTYTATVFTVEGNFHVDAAPVVTTYRVGGEGADFATLSAAAAALRATPMTSDVTLLICADIAEVGNVGLVNNTDYTLTIRPDAAVKRTISFGTVADNAGPSGHIVIGYGLAGWAATPTKNVVIDGSFDGKGQYIEIQGGTIGGVDVVYYGHVTNSVVKNCRLISPRTSGTTYVAHFRTEQLASGTPSAANKTDNAPEGVGFENCYMQVTGVANAQAIYFNGSNSSTAAGKPKDCFIRGCEIISNLRGIFFNGAINAVIENNTFRMPTASSGFLAHAIMGNAQKGTIIVRGNHFAELKSTNVSAGDYGICGITASGGADVWIIENNVFAGLDATASGAADKAIALRYVRCGDSCVVRHNTFYMPALTNKPSTELVAASPIAALYLAATKAYPVENNLFVSMETVANNSLIRGALNANVKNNAFFHKGGNAAILAGAVVAADYNTFLPIADEGSVWTQPAFANVAEADFSVALNQALIMPRIADVLKDINGNDRREATYAGAIEGPEFTAARYLAGNGAEGSEWCDGHNWSPNGTALVNGKIRYNALPAGRYEFKITDGTWGYTMDYSKVVDESKAAHVFTEGDGGNIMFYMAETSPVMIQLEGEAIRVLGKFVEKPSHYLSGNGNEDPNSVWCDGADWSLSATPLFGDSIVYESLQTGMVFQFKVTKGSWTGALNINNVLAECRANYVYGSDNITFQMAEAGPVVIKVIGDSVGVYGNFADPDAVVISSYTIVGDEALMGTGWSVTDANNDMTEVNGVWSLVKEDVEIAAGKYWYKVVGNHSYSVYEFPGANQSNEYEFLESGVYTLTFTFIPGDEPSLTLSALKTSTGVGENVISNEPVKFIHNGQVCIRRNGMIFTVTGTRVQ